MTEPTRAPIASLFDNLFSQAHTCKKLSEDIDRLRPITYEQTPSSEQREELLGHLISRYQEHFEQLFATYESIVHQRLAFSYDMESCILRWWGACDDLRDALQGTSLGVLDTADGLDNALLGIQALSNVRASQFFKLFDTISANANDHAPATNIGT